MPSIPISTLNLMISSKRLYATAGMCEAIRSPEVSAVVSQVAVHPAVRKQMVIMQRDMARNHSVVMDGRDIGECVLPDADYKFYVTAPWKSALSGA